MDSFFKEIEYREYTDKFSDTVFLWKLEDQEWVKERKELWDLIIEREKLDARDLNKKYWAERERFFLRAKPQINDKKIYLSERMALTPFTEINQIRNVFSTEHRSLKQGTHESILEAANRYYRAVPDEFHRVKLITDALFSKDQVCLIDNHGKKQKIITTPPNIFTIMYVNEAIFYMNLASGNFLDRLAKSSNRNFNGLERSYVELTLDYFVKSIEIALEGKIKLPRVQLREDFPDKLKSLSELVLNYSPDIKSSYRDMFVDNFKKIVLGNESVASLIQ